MAFVPNPEDKPQVDHINTIRSDNRATNLRWATGLENMNNPASKPNQRACKLGDLNPSKAKRKTVAQIDPITDRVIETWVGVNEMCAKLGYLPSGIIRCCNGKIATSYGYKWKYVS
jgi:hypothetical protein